MTSLSIIDQPKENIFSVLQKALNQKIISMTRFETLQIEIETLTLEFVKKFNHQASTSLSKEDFKFVLNTIDYLFMHGYNDNILLNEMDIHFICDIGIEEVKKDITKINEVYKELISNCLPILNERYFNVVYKQISDYLELLRQESAIFSYGNIQEDLDYPLIDGLPLNHDMYNLKGTDLVLYYLTRLNLENKFCRQFKDELTELKNQFETIKKISFECLPINLFELVMDQLIAYQIIHNERGILLYENEIDLLKETLRKNKSLITESIEVIKKDCDKDLIEYIKKYERNIISRFNEMIKYDIELLIYKKESSKTTEIKLDAGNSNKHFLSALSNINRIDQLNEKIEYLKSLDLSVFDLLDLFENDIFYGAEYREYFDQCDSFQIAIIIKVANSHLFVFDQKWKINDELFQELVSELAWQKELIEYLTVCGQSKKEEIETALNEFAIRQ